MAGRLVLVVGPSGAGKDTLIAGAKAALAGDRRFVFPRRVVTRPTMAALEDHESVSPEAFAAARAAGAYALDWEAHGLGYGLPASLVDDIAAGRVVVFNGSRAMVPAAQAKFPGVQVLLIEATPEAERNRVVYVGHQANLTMLDAVVRRCEIPAERHFHNIVDFGNQAATGAPAVISQRWKDFKPGDIAALIVVGSGLSWSSVAIEFS